MAESADSAFEVSDDDCVSDFLSAWVSAFVPEAEESAEAACFCLASVNGFGGSSFPDVAASSLFADWKSEEKSWLKGLLSTNEAMDEILDSFLPEVASGSAIDSRTGWNTPAKSPGASPRYSGIAMLSSGIPSAESDRPEKPPTKDPGSSAAAPDSGFAVDTVRPKVKKRLMADIPKTFPFADFSIGDCSSKQPENSKGIRQTARRNSLKPPPLHEQNTTLFIGNPKTGNEMRKSSFPIL